MQEEIVERIIGGAIEEFKDVGIRFTMDSLSRRLGMSKRTIYEVVSSKKELFELVVDHTFADVKKQQRKIFENDQLGLLEKIEQLFGIVPSYSDRLDYRRVAEIRHIFPGLYDKIVRNINNDWDQTITLLEEGMNAGVIKKKNMVVLKALLCEAFEKLLDGDFLIANQISYEVALKETISIIMDGLVVGDREGTGWTEQK